MSLPAGADIVPINQPIMLRIGDRDLHAIAMATDGSQMHYLVLAGYQLRAAGAPYWITEAEIEMSFLAPVAVRTVAED